ncbi:hypothetical protein V8E54_001717 [Elaphomyces granulatus]
MMNTTNKRKSSLSSTLPAYMLAELDALKAYFTTQLHKPQLVEIRQLRSSEVSELRVLSYGGEEEREEEEEEEEGRSEQDIEEEDEEQAY